MKILSTAEMQACDRLTSERFGLSSTDLMRNAATAIAHFAIQQFPEAQSIGILCGRGNNGGDGLMAANLLARQGKEVTVLLIGTPDDLKGDVAIAWQELTAVNVMVLQSGADLPNHSEFFANDLILDAVVGTGFKGLMRGLPLVICEWLRSTENLPPILAIDLPSGWDADSTEATQPGPVYPADAVITFTTSKPAHVFGQLTPTLRHPIVVAPIGSPEEAILSEQQMHWSGSAKAITEPERPADSNKGMYGHVLVIGGSPGKSGAPAMASLAAMRTGSGLVTAAVTPSVLPLVASIAPELMTQSLAVTPAGEISTDNLSPENLKALLKGITVLALGPGLGTTPEAVEFSIGLLTQSHLPAVADADALNAISLRPGILPSLSADRTLVLTPHPGEMARLTGLTIKEVQAGRIRIARDFATKNNVILVLKGWRTLIAHPNGQIAVNTTGNPSMAKGGSGDLLTGMVASLLGQHPGDPGKAVEAAVYLHGLAADITVRSSGIAGDQHTLLATDSLHYLHQAFRYRPQPNSGYCWLQGQNSSLSIAGAS